MIRVRTLAKSTLISSLRILRSQATRFKDAIALGVVFGMLVMDAPIDLDD